MKLRHLLPAILLAALPLTATHALADVSITIAPPVIPVYEQPPCPVEGYLWTPGYYDYGPDGYYWTPGVWCAPPRVGFLWTPGFWGFDDGFYAFHSGYWGPTVGFYGGVNYGYGYGGYGYYGGRWDGAAFRYNTAVTRVNTTVIHNTYVDKTVIREGARPGGASFNGRGGIQARPDARQLAAARGPHLQPTAAQTAQRGPERHIGTPARNEGGFAGNSRQGLPHEQPSSGAERPARDGLSPEERQVVNRRQAAMEQRRTPEGYGYDRSSPRQGGDNARAEHYPAGNNGAAPSPGHAEKVQRQEQKRDRRTEGGGQSHQPHDDHKRDKHDDQGR